MLHSESKIIILTVSLDKDKYRSDVHFLKKKPDREKMVISRIGLKNTKGLFYDQFNIN